jgi:hypothetical protein
MNYTLEQLNAAFEILPESLQDIIMSEDTNETIIALMKVYNIETKQGEFRREVFALCVGLTTTDEFTHNIQRTFGLEVEESEDLLYDLDAAVLQELYTLGKNEFEKIKDQVKEHQNDINLGDSSIKNHILNEIENPRPSPLVSVPQYTSHNIPQARQAPIPSKPTISPRVPSFTPIKPLNFPTARFIPPLANKPENTPSPFLIAKKPEAPVAPSTPETHPAIPEHTEDELMPLIIQTSKQAQADGTHVNTNTTDPYREPPTA